MWEVYGENAVRERRTQEWIARSRSGNSDVKDAPRSGWPVAEKVGEILQLVEQDRHASCREMVEEPNMNLMTVSNHLKGAGYKKKLDVWKDVRKSRGLFMRPNISKASIRHRALTSHKT
ncbi:hypothetical protein ANCDUO_20072 [Ancylostoma duodenale]|uniref:Mos1 transposase HTH domain-containing protein n=1 Tax=Ancylostoma duodenale TaxID=51022 RepID=A0A0C2CJC0_9BILA|nr:hypothetical protein ANCDUO_20072 [Ancylostoma duodenale]